MITQMIIVTLKQACEKLINIYSVMISICYYGRLFGIQIDQDLVILYKHSDPQCLEQVKKELDVILHSFFIDHASVVFMSEDEFRKRINVSDKFALSIVRAQSGIR